MYKLEIIFGGGICSCMTVRLEQTVQYYAKHGYYPDEIDSSKQFDFYKKCQCGDLQKYVYGEYNKQELAYVGFDNGWQYKWYDEMQIDDLSKIANVVCPLAPAIINKSNKYRDKIGKRTCVLYRGNDKLKEIPSAPYDTIIEMARATGSESFFIQTDEKEFYDYFKFKFPNTIRIDEIKMIKKDINGNIRPATKDLEQFMTNFLASLKAISQAEKIITTTGNTGLWTLLFRGNTNNVYQYKGDLQQWRKL